VCASGVAAQTDAAAAFALPAALARIQGPSIRLGGGAVTVGVKWTDPTPGATQPPYNFGTTPPSPIGTEPTTVNAKTQFTAFPDIALSYGGKIPALGDRGWGVGLSLQPFGGSIVQYPSDWAGRYHIVKVDREVFSAMLGAGIEVMPQVRIGGGLLYYYTMQTFTQDIWQQGVNPTGAGGLPSSATYPDAQAKLGKMTGGALSYDLSLEVDPVQGMPLTLAVDYKHKATQDLSGDVRWTNLYPALAALPGQVTSATSAKEHLTIPNTLNIGASYRVAKPVLVMATFTFDRWVVYQSDTFTGNNGAVLSVPRNYGNGQTYRAGVAWDVLDMLTLRAGLQRDVSGVDKKEYSPTLPDASSWGGSLGATVKFAKAFSFDAAVFYAMMDKVNVPSSAVGKEPGIGALGGSNDVKPSGTFRGSYEPNAFVFSASLNWQPGAM
jgi:long-chain fatty acid transport protein